MGKGNSITLITADGSKPVDLTDLPLQQLWGRLEEALREVEQGTRERKLKRLLELTSFDSLERYMEVRGFDSMQPGICLRPTCDHWAIVEVAEIWSQCEVCQTYSMMSVPALGQAIHQRMPVRYRERSR